MNETNQFIEFFERYGPQKIVGAMWTIEKSYVGLARIT